MLVEVDLRADDDGRIVRYYNSNEFVLGPRQLLVIQVPAMAGFRTHFQLPIDFWSTVSLVISREATPCIINLRRNASARLPLIIPQGSKILEQVLFDDSSCDGNDAHINAEEILADIVHT